jgi:hypothetical protein
MYHTVARTFDEKMRPARRRTGVGAGRRAKLPGWAQLHAFHAHVTRIVGPLFPRHSTASLRVFTFAFATRTIRSGMPLRKRGQCQPHAGVVQWQNVSFPKWTSQTFSITYESPKWC